MLSAYCTSKPAKNEERNEHGGHIKSQPILPELPQVVVDQKTGKRYFRGRMLGKVRTKHLIFYKLDAHSFATEIFLVHLDFFKNNKYSMYLSISKRPTK